MNQPHADATRVCLGIVVGARGLKGEVRIKSFTAEPEDVAAYGALESEDRQRSYTIKVLGFQNGSVIARIAGIGDRTAADRIKGEKLYVARTALPKTGEGEYYHADLIGLRVERTDGVSVGRVTAVGNYGGGDILDVAAPDGKSTMVPFTASIIDAVDVAAGVVRVVPVPGLFDDGGEKETEETEESDENEAKEGEATQTNRNRSGNADGR